jgi:hypothetical protein
MRRTSPECEAFGRGSTAGVSEDVRRFASSQGLFAHLRNAQRQKTLRIPITQSYTQKPPSPLDRSPSRRVELGGQLCLLDQRARRVERAHAHLEQLQLVRPRELLVLENRLKLAPGGGLPALGRDALGVEEGKEVLPLPQRNLVVGRLGAVDDLSENGDGGRSAWADRNE